MSNPLLSIMSTNNSTNNFMKNLLNKSVRPKNMVLNFMKINNNNNPLISELVEMAEKGDTESVERVVRNYFSNNGMDFDTVKKQVMENLK